MMEKLIILMSLGCYEPKLSYSNFMGYVNEGDDFPKKSTFNQIGNVDFFGKLVESYVYSRTKSIKQLKKQGQRIFI